MCTHPIVEYYQALRDSAPCLSRAATLPKGTKLGLGKRRAPGNTIILSQPYRRRVSTDRLNREGSQLAASLEGEPGPTPAGKTLPHSFPECSLLVGGCCRRRESVGASGRGIFTFAPVYPKRAGWRTRTTEKNVYLYRAVQGTSWLLVAFSCKCANVAILNANSSVVHTEAFPLPYYLVGCLLLRVFLRR